MDIEVASILWNRSARPLIDRLFELIKEFPLPLVLALLWNPYRT